MRLPLNASIEKNKISTTSTILWLLRVKLATPICIVNNNENITWNNQEWLAFPFTLGNITDDGKEKMTVELKISNITSKLGVVIADAKGGGGTEIDLIAVNSALLNDPAAVYLELTFQNAKTHCDTYWVSFTLGIPKDLIKRFPMDSVLKDFCKYIASTGYCGIECGLLESIKAIYPRCNGTLANCRERGNSRRFGGEPGLTGNLG